MQQIMVRRNGKSEVDSPELDVDHELAAAAEEDAGAQAEANDAGAAPEVVRGGEFDKLKAERDTLVDRLARLQAEFENARKRSRTRAAGFPRVRPGRCGERACCPRWTASNARCRPARETSQSFAAESNSSTSNCRMHWSNWDCVRSRPRVSPLIRIFIRRLKWWTPDEAEDHHVLDELQRGYKLKDRLLRPSMVKVASNPKH